MIQLNNRFCSCGGRLSVADVDGYCVHCHADPTTFKDGSPRPLTEKPCAKCGVNPRQYANMPYCRECKNVIARESEARRKEREKAGQMEMGL